MIGLATGTATTAAQTASEKAAAVKHSGHDGRCVISGRGGRPTRVQAAMNDSRCYPGAALTFDGLMPVLAFPSRPEPCEFNGQYV